MSGLFLLLLFITENPVLNAISVDPDQTPRSAAYDLGLYYLPMSLLWDTRHKCVNYSNRHKQTVMTHLIFFIEDTCSGV